ncbi:hypothetical protein U2A4042170033 [Corynebacterium striatum]|nr:hypothetical protein U2A4042170033 [Corynebacterium striatum]
MCPVYVASSGLEWAVNHVEFAQLMSFEQFRKIWDVGFVCFGFESL